MIVTDTLANRMVSFCRECGSGRLHREPWGPMLYIEVCGACKKKGRTATVGSAVFAVIRALGGRLALNNEEIREKNAARRIGVVIRRLGR